MLDLEPWHEETHRLLMWLLNATGQRNDALAQYESCCRILGQELGVPPAEETTALYEQIKQRRAAGTPQRTQPHPVTRQRLEGPVDTLSSFTTFGALLHYLRRSERMTQRELAIAVGYSESMISRLEHDERPPDTATIMALFVPALHLDGQPDVVAQLVRLANESKHKETGKSTSGEQTAASHKQAVCSGPAPSARAADKFCRARGRRTRGDKAVGASAPGDIDRSWRLWQDQPGGGDVQTVG